MLLLGHIDKGYTPGESDYTLPDGRVVGPFESLHARDMFGHWFGKKSRRLFSALDLFEGTVVGDEYQLVYTDEVSLEMHPFREIYDIWPEGDNGQVVFEMPVGFSVVDPRRLVMVDSPEICERERTLRPASAPPATMNIEQSDKPVLQKSSKHHGEIVVIDTGAKHGYVVGWRPDSRHLKEIVSLSRHDHRQTAERAAQRASGDYNPLVKKRKNRLYDMQREALYTWEHSFAADDQQLADISEARELATRICEDLGIKPPTVSLGRATLVTRSYYRLGHIVLSKGMLQSHTVVHEVAHHVVTHLRLPKEGGHGPVFAGTLLSLMTEYMGADRETALDNARDRGIVVNTDVERRLGEVFVRRRQNSANSPSPTV
jgi:predicted Zn-dependent protease with MMP-like domain